MRSPFLNVEPANASRWFSWWRWATGDDAKPVALTTFSDWIFERSDGSIHHLSVLDGSISRLADSRSQLNSVLSGPDAGDEYLSATFAERAWRSGKTLGPGECFSFIVPPVMGGSFEESNVRPAAAAAYQLVMAQLARLVRLVPEGTATGRLRMRLQTDGVVELLLDGVPVR